jgi:hypothetical protein
MQLLWQYNLAIMAAQFSWQPFILMGGLPTTKND